MEFIIETNFFIKGVLDFRLSYLKIEKLNYIPNISEKIKMN